MSSRSLVSIVLVAAGVGGVARAQDTHLKLYGGASYVSPLSRSSITLDAVTDSVEESKEAGWNAGLEARWSKLFGIEIDYVRATHDISFGGTTIGSASFSPLSATLNFHVVHTTILDFYLGPSATYVDWGDIEPKGAGTATIGTRNDRAWGAAVGLDIGLGKHVALSGGLRYVNAALELADGQSTEVRPLIGRLGVAVRF